MITSIFVIPTIVSGSSTPSTPPASPSAGSSGDANDPTQQSTDPNFEITAIEFDTVIPVGHLTLPVPEGWEYSAGLAEDETVPLAWVAAGPEVNFDYELSVIIGSAEETDAVLWCSRMQEYFAKLVDVTATTDPVAVDAAYPIATCGMEVRGDGMLADSTLTVYAPNEQDLVVARVTTLQVVPLSVEGGIWSAYFLCHTRNEIAEGPGNNPAPDPPGGTRC